MTGPANSGKPTTSFIVGGVYNVTPPAPADGQAVALQLDSAGNLKTTGGGGGGGNVNITGVNSNPPALSNPLPVELSDGTNAVGTAGNPLSVNVITGGGSNPSVAPTGAAVPADATFVGGVDGNGNLVALTVLDNQLQTNATLNGQLSDSAVDATWTSATTVNTVVAGTSFSSGGLFTLVQNGGTVSAGTVVFELSADGNNWFSGQVVDALTGTPVSSYVLQAGTSKAFYMSGNVAQLRMRLSVAIIGTLSVNVQAYAVAVSADSLVSVANPITGFALDATLTNGTQKAEMYDGTNVIGTTTHPVQTQDQSGGSTGATAPAKAEELGLIAVTSTTGLPTAVSGTQLVGGMSDKFGRQVNVLNTVRDLAGTAFLNSSSGSLVSFIGSGGSNVFTDIITFVATNESSTATVVSLSDGTTTYKFALAANGGIVINFPTPLPAASAATAWQVLNSGAVAVDYMAVYAKNK